MSIGAAGRCDNFFWLYNSVFKIKRGIMSGSPITFGGQHLLNLLLGIGIFVLIFYLCKTQSANVFWTVITISFLVGVLLIIPIGGADMPVVISMLNSYSGWYDWNWLYFRKHRFNYYRRTSWFFWSNTFLYNV